MKHRLPLQTASNLKNRPEARNGEGHRAAPVGPIMAAIDHSQFAWRPARPERYAKANRGSQDRSEVTISKRQEAIRQALFTCNRSKSREHVPSQETSVCRRYAAEKSPASPASGVMAEKTDARHGRDHLHRHVPSTVLALFRRNRPPRQALVTMTTVDIPGASSTESRSLGRRRLPRHRFEPRNKISGRDQ